MSSSKDSLYLIHIRECLTRVADYTSGGQNEFMEDIRTQDAVLRNLQIMGESTQRLSASLKAANADIEWSELAAFRNILVHNYLGMDLTLIWKIIAEDMPLFRQQIETIIQGMNYA